MRPSVVKRAGLFRQRPAREFIATPRAQQSLLQSNDVSTEPRLEKRAE